MPRPSRITLPTREPVPILRRLGGPQGRSELVRKISPSLGFDLRNVRPLDSRHTDYAMQTTFKWSRLLTSCSTRTAEFLDQLNQSDLINNAMPYAFPMKSLTLR